MIDYLVKKQMAKLIHKLAINHPASFRFDDLPSSLRKKTLATFLNREIWPFYDDLYGYKLQRKYRQTADNQALVVRMILFLYTDVQYKWPIVKKRFDLCFILVIILVLLLLKFSLVYWIPAIILLYIAWIELKKIWWKLTIRKGEGDLTVWPFFTQQEYQYALANNQSTLLASQGG